MTSPNVLVLRRGAPGLSAASLFDAVRNRLPDHEVRLARTPGQERELVRDAAIVTGNGISHDLVSNAEDLRLYAHTSTGTGFLPMDTFRKKNVAVTSASGLMPYVAEQAMGFVLAFARDLHEGWRRGARREPRHYQPPSLIDRTVTIVGLGPIGRQIAERLSGFGVETIGVRYTPSKGGPADSVVGYDEEEFHEALSETDYLVLACPLTDITRGLVDSAAFGTLPGDAVVVNVARGAVVDTDALVRALRRNTIRGAALDVTEPDPLPPDHPLWRFENVLITPHNAGNAPSHWDRIADLLAQNVEQIEETGDYGSLENLVLAPDDSA